VPTNLGEAPVRPRSHRAFARVGLCWKRFSLLHSVVDAPVGMGDEVERGDEVGLGEELGIGDKVGMNDEAGMDNEDRMNDEDGRGDEVTGEGNIGRPVYIMFPFLLVSLNL